MKHWEHDSRAKMKWTNSNGRKKMGENQMAEEFKWTKNQMVERLHGRTVKWAKI